MHHSKPCRYNVIECTEQERGALKYCNLCRNLYLNLCSILCVAETYKWIDDSLAYKIFCMDYTIKKCSG